MRNFLIVGQTGVGKSSFVNATFGVSHAKVAEFQACTKVVKHYAYGTPYGDVCLIDTPGLGEGSSELDTTYLRMIRTSTEYQQLHATLYVTPLHETRFRSSEKNALVLLTQVLDTVIWSKAWLVLTFASLVKPDRLELTWRKRWEQITLYLQEITAPNNRFRSFEQIILIDSVVSHWTKDAVPIASILTK